MATLYGVAATKRLVNIPSDKSKANEQGGDVKVAFDTYTAAGNLGNGDVLVFGKLPKGARVVGYWIKYSDLGTTGTGNLGWAASADAVEAASTNGFFAALDFNAAAATIAHGDQENEAGLGREFLADVDVQLTMTAATTAAGSISVCIEYVLT